MNLLVIKTTYFVDPHGSPDEGGVEKFITSDQTYLKFKKDKYYNDDNPEEPIDEEDVEGSCDGYNSEVYTFKVKKVTEEQASIYSKVIKAYNNLK